MLHSTVYQLGALCWPRGVGSGWAGGGRLKGEGYVTDSLYCTVEANSIVEQLYSNKRIIPLKNLTLNFIWNKTWFQIKMLSCVWSTVSCAHLTCVFIQRDFFPSAACKTFPSLFAAWKSFQNLKLNTIFLTWLFSSQTWLVVGVLYLCDSLLSSRLKTLDSPLYSTCFQGPECWLLCTAVKWPVSSPLPRCWAWF